MTTRLVADYNPESVSRRAAERSLREARRSSPSWHRNRNEMAIRPKAKRNVHEYAEDLMHLVRSHFPDAEFEVQRARAKDYALVVIDQNQL